MTLGSLMKRHLDALGGIPAVTKIKSIRVTCEGKAGGLTASMIKTDKLPDKQHIKIDAGPYHMTQAYAGNAGWSLDPGGDISHEASTVEDARSDLYLTRHAYALNGPEKGKVTLRSEREAGTGDYIVDIADAGFSPSTLYFDPQTYLIAKVKKKDGVTYYSVYQKFGGVLFPTVEKDVETDASENMTATITKVEINIPVDDSLFEAPKDANPAEPELEHKK